MNGDELKRGRTALLLRYGVVGESCRRDEWGGKGSRGEGAEEEERTFPA